MTAADVLTRRGVFKGAHGLEGLLNAKDFWELQPYGTRLYYGGGIADYLHIDALRAAVRALAAEFRVHIPCKGKNCSAINGQGHSEDCDREHEQCMKNCYFKEAL